MSKVPPAARLATLIILVAATFIDTRIVLLPIVLIVLGIFIAIDGLFPVFLKFLLGAELPMTLMLIGVWGWVAKAPPGVPMGTDPIGGVRFALLISLRLAVLGGAFQLAMLSIPTRLLPATLRGWGLRGEGLVVALGVFAVSRWAGIKQLPYLLRPLLVWSIRSAVHRADVWEQRAMLLRVEQLPTESNPFSSVAGAISLALAILWLIAAIFFRWHSMGIR